MDAKGYQSGNEITAYPSVELAVEAMKLGAADYLIKPVAR
jgi:ActR/RegA family two-component response regulator